MPISISDQAIRFVKADQMNDLNLAVKSLNSVKKMTIRQRLLASQLSLFSNDQQHIVWSNQRLFSSQILQGLHKKADVKDKAL